MGFEDGVEVKRMQKGVLFRCGLLYFLLFGFVVFVTSLYLCRRWWAEAYLAEL